MLLIRWFLNALALLAVSYLIPGVKFASFWSLLIASLVLGFLNAIVRPLILLLTLPVNFLTIGLFTLVINALVFWLAGSIVKGFNIANFAAAFWGALVYYILIMLINLLEKAE